MATSLGKYGDTEVSRAVEVFGRAEAFGAGRNLDWATVSPPGPFSGTATYRHLGGRATRWRGNLKVDFAGYRGYPLTVGPSLTSFEHGECNDSHLAGQHPPLLLCLVGWSG
jgi:hypothetical protein